MKTVLVIDDEPDIAWGLKELFELEGYRVLTACSGKEGLQRLEESRPQLVLLDLMMPVMTGWEVLAALANNPACRDVRVVIMSAIDGSAAAAEYRCPYVKKPFDATDLLEVASRLLSA